MTKTDSHSTLFSYNLPNPYARTEGSEISPSQAAWWAIPQCTANFDALWKACLSFLPRLCWSHTQRCYQLLDIRVEGRLSLSPILSPLLWIFPCFNGIRMKQHIRYISSKFTNGFWFLTNQILPAISPTPLTCFRKRHV